MLEDRLARTNAGYPERTQGSGRSLTCVSLLTLTQNRPGTAAGKLAVWALDEGQGACREKQVVLTKLPGEACGGCRVALNPLSVQNRGMRSGYDVLSDSKAHVLPSTEAYVGTF